MSLNFIRTDVRQELHSKALYCLDQGFSVALVTLVNVEGSAPYPFGSQMLVSSEGEYVGQITGGCAEQAIADQARMAIKDRENRTQRYGMGSTFFDIQLPCGSGIDVHIDVTKRYLDFKNVASALENRRPVTEKIVSSIGSFDKTYHPNQRLVLLGQGPILIACAKIGLQAGFDLLCIAQNELTSALLAQHGLVSTSLSNCPDLSNICDEYTGVVSLFHEHEHETTLLAQALESNAYYIGALGSRRTHCQRLDALLNHGIDRGGLERIYGPVGVNISAKTPSQIAVAVVAQAIDELNIKHFSS